MNTWVRFVWAAGVEMVHNGAAHVPPSRRGKGAGEIRGTGIPALFSAPPNPDLPPSGGESSSASRSL